MAATNMKITKEQRAQNKKRKEELETEARKQQALYIKAREGKKKASDYKAAMEAAQDELQRLIAMEPMEDVENTGGNDAEEQTEERPNLSELDLLQEQRRQLDEHEAELRRKYGKPPRKQHEEETSLFLSSEEDSSYESDVVIPIGTSEGQSSSLPSDGKDLCFMKRGTVYYVIY